MRDIQWGKPTEDLAISLSVAQRVYRAGEPITLNIALKNVGREPVPIVVRLVWYDYSLSVRYEGRTELARTPYAVQMIEAAEEGRRVTRQLTPGEVLSETLELAEGYRMTEPGKYHVVATRETYKRGKLDEYATVTSNELVIEVRESREDQ